MDGRFLFPAHSVRWGVLEPNGRYRHMNPIGRMCIYDVVLRSESARQYGRVVLRNRGAVTSFVETKNEWSGMKGFTSFAKGVKVTQKPPAFRERIRPGALRSQKTPHSPGPEHSADQGDPEAPHDGASDWGAFPDLA